MGKPHGLGGEMYVVPISDDPHRFDAGSRLIDKNGDDRIVERSRPHHQRFLVKFEGIDTRDDADRLRGPLYVTLDDLRDLDESEFWEHDLVGCSAVSPDGKALGSVVGVVSGAAQDLLAIETPHGERYVPIVKEMILRVDVTGREVIVDAPPGLLD